MRDKKEIYFAFEILRKTTIMTSLRFQEISWVIHQSTTWILNAFWGIYYLSIRVSSLLAVSFSSQVKAKFADLLEKRPAVLLRQYRSQLETSGKISAVLGSWQAKQAELKLAGLQDKEIVHIIVDKRNPNEVSKNGKTIYNFFGAIFSINHNAHFELYFFQDITLM